MPTEGDAAESVPVFILDGSRAGLRIEYVDFEGRSILPDKIVWSQLVGRTYVEPIANVPETITDIDGATWNLKNTSDKSVLIGDEMENNLIAFNYSQKR